MYDNLVESLERYKSSSGFGCILAHSMGLGKTLQVISFVDILLRHTGAHTVLAIVPVSTVIPSIISMLLLCSLTYVCFTVVKRFNGIKCKCSYFFTPR